MTTVADQPQHLQALERANQIRLDQADLKNAIRYGQVTVSEVLLDTPECAESMAIADLICVQVRWGATRTASLLSSLWIPERKPVGSLTRRQRDQLATHLEGRAGRPRSMGPPPERSLAQRRGALDRANEVRVKRARLKTDLKAGRAQVDVLLLDPPACLATMKVFDLLLAAPKYGRTKATKMLVHCRIAMSKTVGGITGRQRDDLVRLLRADVERWGTRRTLTLTQPPEPPVTSGRRVAASRRGWCATPGCGVKLLAPDPDGLCGFCIQERAAA